MKTTNKIDVHHHIFPKEYVDALKKAGVENSFGVDFPDWTAETSLKHMKKNGIQIAMLSISAPGVYVNGIDLPDGFPEKTARANNEFIAELKDRYPERFGGFATVPLLNLQASLEELNHAYDNLHLDGVCLLSNYLGKYLGDADFDPFFEALNSRKAVVYLHPADPGPQFDAGLDMPYAHIDAPFETTRAVANLMHQGVLDKYPDIRYILSHGGGTIPYIAWRMASIDYAQKGKRIPVMRTLYDFLVNGEPTKGLRLLKKMYYDTAIVSGKYQVKTLQSFAGPDHIVFGTDLCIAKLAPVWVKNLYKDGDFTEEEYEKMSYGNCLELFPSLKKYYA
jgi:predicted TIM-barrel fold metal-dependent hydrolase